MIIDIHTHMPAKGRGKIEEILAEARRLGISRLCNLGIWPLNATPEQIVAANNQTMRLVRRRPDVFVGFCFLNPNHAKSFILKEITRCVEKGNLKGIKPEVETNARSRRLDPIMEASAR